MYVNKFSMQQVLFIVSCLVLKFHQALWLCVCVCACVSTVHVGEFGKQYTNRLWL